MYKALGHRNYQHVLQQDRAGSCLLIASWLSAHHPRPAVTATACDHVDHHTPLTRLPHTRSQHHITSILNTMPRAVIQTAPSSIDTATVYSHTVTYTLSGF
ncbi:hypothetical protein K438DRAFT_1956200 [Mycena galopus ATCC 62051]|nr:hypothetical protein K438DRAFT_1956200 [Mycena galopus ATCC 62051]